MSPKTLQMIMGHSSIEFSLNVYTRVKAGDIMENFRHTIQSPQFNFCGYNRTPNCYAPSVNFEDEVGDIDFNETADDDE